MPRDDFGQLTAQERAAAVAELREQMAKQGLTQAAAAEAMNVTQQAISRATKQGRVGAMVARAIERLSGLTLEQMIAKHSGGRYPNLARAVVILRETGKLDDRVSEIVRGMALQSPGDLPVGTWIILLEQVSALASKPITDDDLPPPPAGRGRSG